jgi:hypothetical protein
VEGIDGSRSGTCSDCCDREENDRERDVRFFLVFFFRERERERERELKREI